MLVLEDDTDGRAPIGQAVIDSQTIARPPLTNQTVSTINTLLPAMENTNVPDLVGRLASNEDAVRKLAVFKLQSSIGDPSFADVFIAEGGLSKLRYLTLHATGNTLAYSLTSFARLLEVDKGWEFVDQELVGRV